MDKVTCDNCNWRGDAEEVLEAPNPFEPDDLLIACPKCKTVNEISCACIADNCWKPASCGTPTVGGYIHTCGKHAPRVQY
jgi:hypothetical protein